MRLKDSEIRIIKNAVHAFDPDADLYLFGSRADDSRKGGDIDLLVLSKILTYNDKLKIKQQIFKKMDEQKIDIIIQKNTSDPFVRMALKQGIRL